MSTVKAMNELNRKTQLNKTQGGFTLIELMIVVAIVGILAAIAIPQYQNYTVRAQVTEALSAAASARTAVAEYRISNGSWPTTAQAGITDYTGITTGYVSSLAVGDNGVITVGFTNRGTTPITGDISFTPTVQANDAITWACAPAGSGGLDAKYLPANCRP